MNLDACKEILFSNFTYNPNVYYFFYFGDIKTYSLNIFLQEMLAKTIHEKEVQFIAVVPDIFTQYNYRNIIVINPTIQEHNQSPYKSTGQQQHTPPISCRISSAEFMTAVSSSPAIRDLIDTILQRQNSLYINLYESRLEMTLDEINGVRIIGPDKKLANKFNNKITQYRKLDSLVPTVDYRLCEDIECLLKTTNELRNQWSDGIFISCAYSAAGANSVVTQNQQQVEEWCEKQHGLFLISRYLPHVHDPTVLAVVANENDVYIAGVADQVIVNGNRFIGSTYPSVVSEKQKKKLHDHTVSVGQMLGRHGYRGIFGCDYIIDNDGQIFFIEINARKQGTTLEFCFTLEQSLPEGSPMLPELEYFAVIENRFPIRTVELTSNRRKINWGTYNYKIHQRQTTIGYIPQNPYERETFKKVAQGELVKDFVILEHIGTNFMVMPGTFLARIVSVATNREDMEEGLRQGVGFIKQTIHEAEE